MLANPSQTTPSLSVIMTVYNSARFLTLAIESVLKQTFSDFEFIIVDDGSKDTSSQIIRSFALVDSRIRPIFLKKNMGIPQAANCGLKTARAPLIARVDSDDISLPERFERQVAYLNKHPEIYMLGCRSGYIDAQGKQIKGSFSFKAGRRTIARVTKRGDYVLLHPTLMYRTKVVRAIGGYRRIFFCAEDNDLYIRMLDKYGPIFENLSDVLYLYRKTSTSITKKTDFQTRSVLIALIFYSSFCRRKKIPDPIDNARNHHLKKMSISSPERIWIEGRAFLLLCYFDWKYAQKIVSEKKILPYVENILRQNFPADQNSQRKIPDNLYPVLCMIVARICLRKKHYALFLNYLYQAFHSDMLYMTEFLFNRAISYIKRNLSCGK